MPDASQFGLTEQKGEDGKLRLIGKDDAGNDYEALRCQGSEFTPEDEAFLVASDREHSDPQQLTEFFVARNKAAKEAQESAQDKEWEVAAENVVRQATVGQVWPWFPGLGPGEIVKAENGSAIPRRRKWILNDKTGELIPQSV